MAALLWGLLWPFWKVLLNLVASLVAVVVWLCKHFLSWLLWVLWPILLLLVFVGWFAISAKSCEAGWFDWLWGNDNADARAAEQFQRAAELASESTRIAGEVAAAQVRQANEQARQNSQVAEMLKELSSERRDYARQLEELSAIALRDSEWAAALSALEPGLICLTVLLIAGLVLALALKNSPGNDAEDGGARGDALLAIDVLVEEISRAPIRPYQAVSGWGCCWWPLGDRRATKNSSTGAIAGPVVARSSKPGWWREIRTPRPSTTQKLVIGCWHWNWHLAGCRHQLNFQ